MEVDWNSTNNKDGTIHLDPSNISMKIKGFDNYSSFNYVGLDDNIDYSNETTNYSSSYNFDNLSNIEYFLNGTDNRSMILDVDGSLDSKDKVYWALLLLTLPLVAVFGNILVILSVYKERSLQTVTNYFIVSLAFADLLVAGVVMPFAVYVLINVDWELSDTLCDFYIALDVTCSTASIFNLVAISIDRYIAVTQPIKYSKHKNNKRVFLTIAIVWVVSAAIGSPIVLGLNTSPERIPQLCVFYNSDFIIYSSLSSFYIPCLVMIVLYYRIFKAIHERAKKSHRRAADVSKISSTGNVMDTRDKETKSLTKHVAGSGTHLAVVVEADAVTTNTGSGSQAEDDEEEDDTGGDDPTNSNARPDEAARTKDKQTTNSSSAAFSATLSDTMRIEIPVNGNTDSGYGTSHVEETQFFVPNMTETQKKLETQTRLHQVASKSCTAVEKRNGITNPIGRVHNLKDNMAPKKKRRFNLGRRQKSTRKKREKASAKKERKATKTLAIVLGMFLACWVPFFTCNILDAICIKLENDRWRPGMSAFLLTTWLGYVNSCVNPVIYTIFNMEFRKAFKKLLEEFWLCCSRRNT